VADLEAFIRGKAAALLALATELRTPPASDLEVAVAHHLDEIAVSITEELDALLAEDQQVSVKFHAEAQAGPPPAGGEPG
jgi:hypothetical protein